MEVKDWLGQGNKLGQDIWQKKYQYKNESFDQWLDRISVGDNDLKQLIIDKKFLFGGRILSNRGLQYSGKKITFSNCYVVTPPEDNIESIYEVAGKLARTYSYGGGCGIDISKLSPRGAKVNNAANETSGAVSFMDTYSQVTAQIGQNGRRGALMISLDCHHPDLEEFIDIKTDLSRVTKANISIRITDDFMEAVDKDEDFTLSFIRKETGEEIKKVVRAREVFMKLAKNNWDFAEPGCLFWDRISNWNMLSTDPDFEYAGTNPCAEEPLPAGGSCLLGSMNLAAYVLDPFTKKAKFDFDTFKKDVKTAIKALNDVLDEGQPLHPLQEQRDSVRDWRQVGLGVMGIADMLIKLGLKYGSNESLVLCDLISYSMAENSILASAELAKELRPYPNYKPSVIDSGFIQMNTDPSVKEVIVENGLRNSQLLTIAPTGTISTMLGISGGIEPVFANSYTRKTESLHGHDEYYKVYTPIVQEYMDKYGVKSEEDLPDYFVVSENIPYENRIKMQGIWQSHIDASISSTVNLPESASVEDVYNLYMEAWKNGLKGITIYRSGCKRDAVLSAEPKPEKREEKVISKKPSRGEILPTSDNSIGLKRKLMTGCGSLHCEAFFDIETGELHEIYLSKGSTGGCNSFMIGLSRMISLSARAGVPLNKIIDQLMSVTACPSYAARHSTKKDTSKGSCCPVAIGYALKEMYKQFQEMKGTLSKQDEPIEEPAFKTAAICPECGEPLVFENGCNTCKACGWSAC